MSVTATTRVNVRGQARTRSSSTSLCSGARSRIATYSDIDAVEEPSQADHVAFGRVDAPNGFTIMAYDVQPSKGYDPGENAFYITLQGTAGREIQPLWDALATSATSVLRALAPAPFAPCTECLPTVTASPGSLVPTPLPMPTNRVPPRRRGRRTARGRSRLIRSARLRATIVVGRITATVLSAAAPVRSRPVTLGTPPPEWAANAGAWPTHDRNLSNTRADLHTTIEARATCRR